MKEKKTQLIPDEKNRHKYYGSIEVSASERLCVEIYKSKLKVWIEEDYNSKNDYSSNILDKTRKTIEHKYIIGGEICTDTQEISEITYSNGWDLTKETDIYAFNLSEEIQLELQSKRDCCLKSIQIFTEVGGYSYIIGVRVNITMKQLSYPLASGRPKENYGKIGYL